MGLWDSGADVAGLGALNIPNLKTFFVDVRVGVAPEPYTPNLNPEPCVWTCLDSEGGILCKVMASFTNPSLKSVVLEPCMKQS